MSDHPTCDATDCVICAEREREQALKLARGLRPAGRLLQTIAKIKARARDARARGKIT